MVAVLRIPACRRRLCDRRTSTVARKSTAWVHLHCPWRSGWRGPRGRPAWQSWSVLDPWNSPYWIRYRCDEATGRRVVIIYSFGPNQSREPPEFLGDEIGDYILESPGR